MDSGRLLRRVTLDLTGLPPTLEELQAFLKDPSPDAYLRVVDRLLDSPRYGERWGRHWMDVWRYTDEDGRLDEQGKLKKVEWGSPYLWRWRDWIIGSLNDDKGFDRMIQEMIAGDELDPQNPQALAGGGLLVRSFYTLSREVFLADIVDHLPRAFLGLSMNCARCHDHRFEPITQLEYYRFRAFFEFLEVGARTFPATAPVTVARTFDGSNTPPTQVLEGGDPQRPIQNVVVLPGIPEALGTAPLLQPALPPGMLSSGRRLALANWMIDPRNPLTARVAVNHVWARHFGKGLVPTVSDFGVRSKPPSHPELLDWLAIEFRRHGWKQKWLHRLIVTSSAYRMHSAPGPDHDENARRDPENRFLWRFPSHRVEAEVIRDSLLFLAGRLDERTGGPSEAPDDAETIGRRSLYFRSSRGTPVSFLCQFDPAKLQECYEREVSILPQQALVLMNSEFVWRQAAGIATRLQECSQDFTDASFLLLLGRPPTPAERARAETFLSGDPSPGDRNLRRTYLVHALLNHHDFIHRR
jgi:hypothetical protein